MRPYEYITDDFAAALALEDLGKYKTLGFDTETTGLDPLDWNVRLRLVQLAGPMCTYVFDVFKLGFEGIGFLRDFFERRDKIFIAHNLKFDLKFIRMFLGVNHFYKGICTYLAAQLISCGLFEVLGGMSLEDQCMSLLGIKLDKSHQLDDWSVPTLAPQQIEYAARDAEVLLDLWPIMSKRLVEQGQMYVAQLEFDAIDGVASIELNGFHLDKQRWIDLARVVTQEWKEKRRTLQEMLAYDGAKSRMGLAQTSLFGNGTRLINLDSPPQLIKALRYHGVPIPINTKTGRETTGKKQMNALALEYPLVNFLREYRILEKQRSSYGLFWLDLINPMTGRLHMDLQQIGAKTGRMSQSRLQQVPTDPRYRRCFTAQGDKKLVGGDYAQFELRILAELCGDPELIRAFCEGKDFHSFTAEKIQRPRATTKNMNFAVVYGSGPTGFSLMCTPPIPLDEAIDMMNADKAEFPVKHKWLEKSGKDAVKFGLSRTRSGRITKYLFDPNNPGEVAFTERNGKNTPIQGLNADVTKRAIKLINDEIQGHPEIQMVHVVHDELQLEATPDAVPLAEEMILTYMPQAAREFVKKVPVVVSTHIGDEWSK